MLTVIAGRSAVDDVAGKSELGLDLLRVRRQL